MQDIKIDKELKDLLRPLKVDEVTKLEQSIKDRGCRSPLILWDNGKHKVLIDGDLEPDLLQQVDLNPHAAVALVVPLLLAASQGVAYRELEDFCGVKGFLDIG